MTWIDSCWHLEQTNPLTKVWYRSFSFNSQIIFRNEAKAAGLFVLVISGVFLRNSSSALRPWGVVTDMEKNVAEEQRIRTSEVGKDWGGKDWGTFEMGLHIGIHGILGLFFSPPISTYLHWKAPRFIVKNSIFGRICGKGADGQLTMPMSDILIVFIFLHGQVIRDNLPITWSNNHLANFISQHLAEPIMIELLCWTVCLQQLWCCPDVKP